MSLGIIGQVGFDRFMVLKYYYSGPFHRQPLNMGNCLSPREPNHKTLLNSRALECRTVAAGRLALGAWGLALGRGAWRRLVFHGWGLTWPFSPSDISAIWNFHDLSSHFRSESNTVCLSLAVSLHQPAALHSESWGPRVPLVKPWAFVVCKGNGAGDAGLRLSDQSALGCQFLLLPFFVIAVTQMSPQCLPGHG